MTVKGRAGMKAVMIGRKLHISSGGRVTKCGRRIEHGELKDVTTSEYLQAAAPRCEKCQNVAGTLVLMGEGAK
jgi:hypothetical protein